LTSPTVLILQMYRAALKASDPASAVAKAVKCQGRELVVGGQRIEVQGQALVVGVGKAAVPMANGLDLTCGCTVAGGLLLTKDGHGLGAPARFKVREAAHPIPDERGVAATREMLDLVASCGAEDVVVALISGGGSALLEAPRPPLALEDLARTTDLLLRAGAPIQDLNAVRTPLSLVKGGGLRAAAPDACFVTLLLSDVLGNDARIIASGPTISSNASGEAALSILDRYGVTNRVSDAVVEVLREGRSANDVHVEEDVVLVVADNEMAVEAARAYAASCGLSPEVVWQAKTGEAADLGKAWARTCLEADEHVDVLLGGGEATVTVRGSGTGGRNTEFALAASQAMDRLGIDDWTIGSIATDGQDGTSDLAGAIADRGTWSTAKESGLDPEKALAENDSASLFNLVGGAVFTGPTGTNVNDIYFAVRRR